MKSNRKLVLMLSSLLMAPVAIADQTADYTYLSVGAASDSSGWVDPLAKKFTDSIDGYLNNESLVLKKNTIGGYLRGSYDFGNDLFTEIRLGGFNKRSVSYFIGLGYHTPISENASFYILAGLSRPNLPKEVHLNAKGKTQIEDGYTTLAANHYAKHKTIREMHNELQRNLVAHSDISPITSGLPHDKSISEGCQESNIDFTSRLEVLTRLIAKEYTSNTFFIQQKEKMVNTITQSKLTVKSQIAPAIEIGSQIKLADDFKLRLAYQARWDRSKLEGKLFNLRSLEEQPISELRRGLSHEGSVEGYYALNANWQAEVGYTISKMLRLGDVSPKAGHQANVGLRYTF